MRNIFLDRNITVRCISVIVMVVVLSLIPIFELKSVFERGIYNIDKIETLENISDYAADDGLIVEIENQRLYYTGYNTVYNGIVTGKYYFLKINNIFLLCDIKNETLSVDASYVDNVSAKGTIRGFGTLEQVLLDELSEQFGYNKEEFGDLYKRYVFVELPAEEVDDLYKYVSIFGGILAVLGLIIISQILYIIFPWLSYDYKSLKKFSNPKEINEIINSAYKGKAYGNNQLVITDSLIAAASVNNSRIYEINDLIWAYDDSGGKDNAKKTWIYLFFRDKGIYRFYMKTSFVKQAMYMISQNKSVITVYDPNLFELRRKSFSKFLAKCESIISPPFDEADKPMLDTGKELSKN